MILDHYPSTKTVNYRKILIIWVHEEQKIFEYLKTQNFTISLLFYITHVYFHK